MKSENKPSQSSLSKGNNRYAQDLKALELHLLKLEFYKDVKLLNAKIYREKTISIYQRKLK